MSAVMWMGDDGAGIRKSWDLWRWYMNGGGDDDDNHFLAAQWEKEDRDEGKHTRESVDDERADD